VLDAALLVLRLGVGLTFAAHGAQKAFGWWSGPGPEGWTGAIRRMGFVPAELFVAMSIGAELIGGLCLALGLFTPVAATVLIGQSIVIIGQVHWTKGFFSTAGGFEFPLQLLLGAVAISLAGAGAWSLDAALGLPFPDPIRLGLIPLGISGGLAAMVLSRQAPEPAGAPTPKPAPGPASRPARRHPTELRRG
jgi:putative oxidoreductase